MKNLLRNIYQNFLSDIIFLKNKNIWFFSRIYFLFYKYTVNIYKIFSKNKNFSIFWNNFEVYNNLGILNYQIMVKDFYLYYNLSLSEKPVIFDVWGNIWDFALVADLYYPNSKIYSFEPILYTYQILENNCKNYRNITTIKKWLWNQKGKLTFYYNEAELDRWSFDKNNFTNIENLKEDLVDITTLDDISSELWIKNIDLLKIDVEGLEVAVVEGGKNILKNTKNIIVECHANKDSGSFLKIYNILSEMDFEFYSFWKIWKNNKKMEVFDVIFVKK